MRAVIQRVSEASVRVNGEARGSIGVGFVILLGIEREDERADAEWLVRKITAMRIFPDEENLMNHSLLDIEGSAVLVVSQFTLHARTKKGTRPSFDRAARPEVAIPLYEAFLAGMESVLGPGRVARGEFGASMKVALVNDGPVTIVLDSRTRE